MYSTKYLTNYFSTNKENTKGDYDKLQILDLNPAYLMASKNRKPMTTQQKAYELD